MEERYEVSKGGEQTKEKGKIERQKKRHLKIFKVVNRHCIHVITESYLYLHTFHTLLTSWLIDLPAKYNSRYRIPIYIIWVLFFFFFFRDNTNCPLLIPYYFLLRN